jgi:hypothetical protein
MARLAERCAAAGAPHLNVNVLTNLLTRQRRRRDLTLEETIALARAFELPPDTLMLAALGRPEAEAGVLEDVFTSPEERDAFLASLSKVLVNMHALRLAMRNWSPEDDHLKFSWDDVKRTMREDTDG